MGQLETINAILLISVLALFALPVFTMFRPQWARVTGPLYAVAEGVLVGAISNIYETLYDGIVVQAILATLAVFAAMLFSTRPGLSRSPKGSGRRL